MMGLSCLVGSLINWLVVILPLPPDAGQEAPLHMDRAKKRMDHWVAKSNSQWVDIHVGTNVDHGNVFSRVETAAVPWFSYPA